MSACPGRDGCFPESLVSYAYPAYTASSFEVAGDAATLDASLDHAVGWVGTAAADSWLQIDTGAISAILGVATQGRGSTCCAQFVKTYTVSVSDDESVWTDVDGGAAFLGNTDRTSTVSNTFKQGTVYARYVRITPLTWTGTVAMRAGLYVGPTSGECGIA